MESAFVAVVLQRDFCLRYNNLMNLTVEISQENDGRWIAEVPELAGVLAYSASREQAIFGAEALALRVIAERLEHDEEVPELAHTFLVAA